MKPWVEKSGLVVRSYPNSRSVVVRVVGMDGSMQVYEEIEIPDRLFHQLLSQLLLINPAVIERNQPFEIKMPE